MYNEGCNGVHDHKLIENNDSNELIINDGFFGFM